MRGLFDDGYGAFWLDGGNRRAHRIAYALTHGPIPAGLRVLHTCDNPPCCNPAHLFMGTNADNSGDMVTKGHAYGEKNGRAKLTEGDVRAIRAEREAGATILPLARKYGVAHSLVERIIDRRAWKHVQ